MAKEHQNMDTRSDILRKRIKNGWCSDAKCVWTVDCFSSWNSNIRYSRTLLPLVPSLNPNHPANPIISYSFLPYFTHCALLNPTLPHYTISYPTLTYHMPYICLLVDAKPLSNLNFRETTALPLPHLHLVLTLGPSDYQTVRLSNSIHQIVNMYSV